MGGRDNKKSSFVNWKKLLNFKQPCIVTYSNHVSCLQSAPLWKPTISLASGCHLKFITPLPESVILREECLPIGSTINRNTMEWNLGSSFGRIMKSEPLSQDPSQCEGVKSASKDVRNRSCCENNRRGKLAPLETEVKQLCSGWLLCINESKSLRLSVSVKHKGQKSVSGCFICATVTVLECFYTQAALECSNHNGFCISTLKESKSYGCFSYHVAGSKKIFTPFLWKDSILFMWWHYYRICVLFLKG